MAKKNDLKNSMSAGLTGGLDSLIQSTAGQKEAQKPKKAKPCIVICHGRNLSPELKADRDPQRRFAKIGIARGYI